MQTSEILTRAKARFLPGARLPTQSCAYLAIGEVVATYEGTPFALPTSQEFREAAKLYARVVGGRPDVALIWRWYDKPERTRQDVLDAFDAAIAIAQDHERADGETPGGQTTTARPRGSNAVQSATG